MRLMIGQICQETNSFSPVSANIQSFMDHLFLEGDEIPRRLKDTNTEIAGFIDVVAREKCQPIYTLVAQAVTSGPVDRNALDFLIGNLLDRLEQAGDVDGIYLALHGAMLTDKSGDGSGLILQAVREKIGSSIPIVASLDLHANVTPLMVECADVLLAYRTFPHTDLKQVGVKATHFLIKVVKKKITPEMAFCKISMLLPPEAAQTDRYPASKLVQTIEKMEAEPNVVTAFFCHVQPWLDVPDVGCSTVVVTNGDKGTAQKKARELADLFWSLRHDFQPNLVPVPKAIQRAICEVAGIVVFLDSADGTSSGASGDNTEVLEALLDAKLDQPAYAMVVDPQVVKLAIKAGVGNNISVLLGGKIDVKFSHPIKVTARIKTISDGAFKCEGPLMCGVELNMGRTAVLVVDKVYIVVMELATFLWDPGVYRSVGLEPKDAKIVVVKSPVAAYADIAEEMIFVDTLGASSPHLTKLPFKRVTHPLYPFQDMKNIRCI